MTAQITSFWNNFFHPYRSRFGGLWTDRNNAPQLIKKRYSSGLLSDEDRRNLNHFIEHGYCIFPEALSSAQVDACLREVNQIYEGRMGPCFFEWHPQGSLHIDPVLPSHRSERGKLLDAYAASEAFRSAMFAPPVAHFLSLIFEEPVLAFQGLFFERGTGQSLHQDAIYVRIDRKLSFAAAWIALEDIKEGSGELEYLSGSHRMPEYLFAGGSKSIKNPDDYPAYLEDRIKTGERLGMPRQRFLPKKGDVLIWSADLLHGGSPVLDPSLTRKSFVTHYCPLKARPAYFESSKYKGPLKWAEGLYYAHPVRVPWRRGTVA